MIVFEQEQKNIKIVRVVTGEKWKENCYFVADIEKGIQFIIDPGYDSYKLLKPILDSMPNNNLKYMLSTHPHHDHIAGVEDFGKKIGMSCLVNEEDKRILMHVGTYALKFSGEFVKRPENIIWINDENEKLLLSHGFKILRTPGHTSGSVCFSYKDYIFTGDTLLKEKIGRTDLPGANTRLIKMSIDEIVKMDDKIVYPGHGEPWTIFEAREWWRNNKENAEELNTFI